MATFTTANEDVGSKSLKKQDLFLIWLDDGADQDPKLKEILLTLFEKVHTFKNSNACLEFTESIEVETPCVSLLVSGKYGQMLVKDRFQPLQQIKDIYVFCFDTVKHSQWAQHCDKVRCVNSDLGKILQQMEHDVKKILKRKSSPNDDEKEQDEPILQEPERFTDDNNLFDQLALDLLLEGSNDDDDDGAKEFEDHCRKYYENQSETEADEERITYFKPNVPIKEWYKPDLFFLQLNSTNFDQLWTFRWFIRLFHRQLTNEHKKYLTDETNFTVNYATWLNMDELEGMKHRISETIIFTEFLLTYTSTAKALNSLNNEKDKHKNFKVIFEINADKNNHHTVPYGKIDDDKILFWFGSRHQITKIEYIEQSHKYQESYWLIGLNLCLKLDSLPSIETLYQYYRKNLSELNDTHYALGRILMYKGLYYQAEKWLQIHNHYEDLAEIAIRQNQCDQASQYLEHLPEDSYSGQLLRAYTNLISSNENIAKPRTILIKICSDATDRVVRARANIALGFINLVRTQQFDQAMEYFQLGHDTLRKYLPDIHPDTAKSYIGVGYAHFSQHKINDAEEYFREAHKLQKQSLSCAHPDIAKTRNGLAHCLSTQKQTVKQALKEFDYALEILKNTFHRQNKKHPEIVQTKNDIEKVRRGKELHARTTLLDYI